MSKCVFCLSEENEFSREEHLVPESLGGDEIVPDGLVCDQCNEYFGRKVEGPALNNPTLMFLRTWLSIPNKKGKQRHYPGYNFDIYGQKGASAAFVPSPERLQIMTKLGGGTFRIPIQPLGSITRLMLKMGLELVAISQQYDVLDSSLDKARTAARAPSPNMSWWLAFDKLKLEDVTEEGIDDEGYFIKDTVYNYSLHMVPEYELLFFYFTFSWAAYLVPLMDKMIINLIDDLNSINKPIYHLSLERVKLNES